jgi:hypothetical protein
MNLKDRHFQPKEINVKSNTKFLCKFANAISKLK